MKTVRALKQTKEALSNPSILEKGSNPLVILRSASPVAETSNKDRRMNSTRASEFGPECSQDPSVEYSTWHKLQKKDKLQKNDRSRNLSILPLRQSLLNS